MKKRIKTNGILVALAIIICIILFKFLLPWWQNPVLNKSLGAIGFTFFLAGQILRIIGRVHKVANSAKSSVLVKEGPYAFVRNPMYLGSFLMGFSFTVLLGNPVVALIFVVIFFARFVPQVRLEEKTLSDKFGKIYEEYLFSVPRFIPKKINTIFKGGFKKYLQIKEFPWIKKEIWAAVGWLVLFLLFALLKDLMVYNLSEYIKELIIFAAISVIFLISLFKLGE